MIDISSIISALIGGALALCGVLISSHLLKKREKAEWTRAEKYKIYTQTIHILEKLHIPCLVTEEALSAEEVELDTTELQSWIEELHTYVENDKALLFLFLPKGIYTKILKLSSRVFSITASKELQKFRIEEWRESAIYDAIKFANSIAEELKTDLGL